MDAHVFSGSQDGTDEKCERESERERVMDSTREENFHTQLPRTISRILHFSNNLTQLRMGPRCVDNHWSLVGAAAAILIIISISIRRGLATG